MNREELSKAIQACNSEQQLRELIRQLVKQSPLGFFTTIKGNQKLLNFINQQTQFIDYKTSIATRVWYVLNDLHGLVQCNHPNCHNKVRRHLSPVKELDRKKYWCCNECFNDDPENKKHIGEMNSVNNRHKRRKKKLPPECKIIYRDEDIVYDNEMNKRISECYETHKKTFKFWIVKEPDLYQYLLEKSYPLDFTKLNLETRVYWVLHKMQRIPCCPTCGRQLDFENVKRRKGWMKFCSGECSDKSNTNDKKIHTTNSIKTWNNVILSSPLVEPLFTFEEYNQYKNDSEHLFKCRCKTCGTVFYSEISHRFFRRESNRQSLFRCPKCFPALNSHSSRGELTLLRFIKSAFPKLIVKKDRKQIHPFEIDIYLPENKIGIEYNGTWWHSYENSKANRFSQLKKTKMCEEKGIKLIHIWEDDWLFRRKQMEKLLVEFITFPQKCLESKIDKSQDIVQVDRQIFDVCIKPNGYKLIKKTPPRSSKRGNVNHDFNTTYDCGKLIYQKIK